MRGILGSFLAFNGALWWFGWLAATFLAGMFAAFAGALAECPVVWLLLALPSLALVLALGDAMIVFGLVLIGSDKLHLAGRHRSMIPERNPLGWFALRALRAAATVLTVVFFCEMLATLLRSRGDSTAAILPVLGIAAVNFATVFTAGRLIDRFETGESRPPW